MPDQKFTLPGYFQGMNLDSPFISQETGIIKYITKNKSAHALDIGCGSGRKTKQIASLSADVLGLDLQQGMIDFAKKKYSAKNITYVCSDLMNIDLPQDHYGIIHSQYAFFTVKDKLSLFKKIYSLLTLAGEFVFSDLTSHDINDEYRITTAKYQEIIQECKFSNMLYLGEVNQVIDGKFTGNYVASFKCSK